MFGSETPWNIFLTLLCYGYVLLIIAVSSRMAAVFGISWGASRKFLHAMIGNLLFLIPFFTSGIYPVLVAAPFIPITFLASPYSPIKKAKGLRILSGITEEGHPLGLVLYAISYSVLALFFAAEPYVIAAGIMPMSYGDSAASLVGEKYGKRRYAIALSKSVEGSTAMLLGSLISVTAALIFFSVLYSFSFLATLPLAVLVGLVVTLAEGFSPKGVDNLTVPILGALTFWLLMKGI
jgi:phytol kinase